MTQYDQMVGRLVKSVTGAEKGSEVLQIDFADGSVARFYHEHDCCETVEVEDVVGDFSDFVGQPITSVEERTSEEDTDYGTCTWTFYEFTCPKGSVTVRWLGKSNGYYSESVDFDFSEGEK